MPFEIPSNAPAAVDRKAGARLITDHLYPVSPRTLETYTTPYRVVGGRAVYRTADLWAEALQRLENAAWRRAPSANNEIAAGVDDASR